MPRCVYGAVEERDATVGEGVSLSCYRCGHWPCDCHDGITIVHGDCREILPLLGPFDLVLTDPPYGISHKANATKGTEATWQGIVIAGDGDVSLRDDVLRAFPNVAAFGGWKRPPLEKAHTALVWDKGPACGGMNFHAPWRMNWELIFIRGHAFKGGMGLGILTDFWQVTWESHGRKHQHEKPVPLLRYLIKQAPDAHTILDPFMGSGTTLRAAKDLGRKAIGIEIEERYCEIAAKRLQQEVLAL